MIENAYGEGVFYEDAVESSWAPAFMQAVEQENLHFVGDPKIDLEDKITKDGYTFTAVVALYPEVAEEKNVKGSRVAGKADCLLFPNIESGNVFFKSATHMGNAEVAAIVVGTKVPCVLTSRGDTPQTKLYSIALACLQIKG